MYTAEVPDRIPSGMLNAEELSVRLQKFRLTVAPATIQELAESGHLPGWRWKNNLDWFFQEAECREWFKKNWLERQNGEPLVNVRLIVESSQKIDNDVFLPRALHWLSPHLREAQIVGAIGVYFLIQNSEIVYIGQSVFIEARGGQHIAEDVKMFDRMVYLPLPRSALDQVEGAMIRTLKPKYNGNSGPIVGKNIQEFLESLRESLNAKMSNADQLQPTQDAAVSTLFTG
jgi:hypothetical protein